MKFNVVLDKVDLTQNVVNLLDVDGNWLHYDVSKDNDYELINVVFRSFSVWNDCDDYLKMVGEYNCYLSNDGLYQYYLHNRLQNGK